MFMEQDLIIDLGAHNGDDTGYYLQKGFRVVSVEANPILAEQIAGRFPHAVRAGRLTVLNIGIVERAGTLPFWVSEDRSGRCGLATVPGSCRASSRTVTA
jgi:FkbM family methyltransferase